MHFNGLIFKQLILLIDNSIDNN